MTEPTRQQMKDAKLTEKQIDKAKRLLSTPNYDYMWTLNGHIGLYFQDTNRIGEYVGYRVTVYKNGSAKYTEIKK